MPREHVTLDHVMVCLDTVAATLADHDQAYAAAAAAAHEAKTETPACAYAAAHETGGDDAEQ